MERVNRQHRMNSKSASPEAGFLDDPGPSPGAPSVGCSVQMCYEMTAGGLAAVRNIDTDAHRIRPVTALPPQTENDNRTTQVRLKSSTSFRTSGPVCWARGIGRAVRMATH